MPWAVFGPLLASVLVLMLCPTAPEAAPVPCEQPPRELPPLAGHGYPRTPQEYELIPEASCVRFVIATEHGEHWLTCQQPSAQLTLGHGHADGQLQISLPIAAMQPFGENNAPISLREVFGLHRAEHITLRMRLASTTQGDVPCVTLRNWDGLVTFGPHVNRLALPAWVCALPGQPIVLQAHGTVSATDYGSPRRGVLGLPHAPNPITFGLSLSFKRRPAQ